VAHIGFEEIIGVRSVIQRWKEGSMLRSLRGIIGFVYHFKTPIFDISVNTLVWLKRQVIHRECLDLAPDICMR